MRHAKPLVACVLAAALLLSMPVSIGAVTWPDGSPKVKVARDRVYGSDRYATSVKIAAAAFPGWAGVDHVIIASGEDRAAADPLTAASLCWAYDAPLLLTQSKTLPSSVRSTLKEIAAVNPGVKVIIVGGGVSVPRSLEKEIKSAIGPSGAVERPWASGDRFSLAAGIASRVRQVAADTSRTIPSAVLVANGADVDTFFDALSASAVSANTGVPVLLAGRDEVPAVTATYIKATAPAETILVGGPTTMSWDVQRKLPGTERLHGADRYATSIAVAEAADARGWADPATTCLAGALPDAVSGAILAAKNSGPLVIVPKDTLRGSIANYLASDSIGVTKAIVLGGSASVSNGLYGELGGNPGIPQITSFKNVATKRAPMKARAGVNTTTLKLYVDGKYVATKSAKPYTEVDFGKVWLAKDMTEVKIVASNPDDATSTMKRKVKRLDYPASTSIVIDKSDFKLYWIKNDVLVKAYPIAHGRVGASTPERTWKIGAKYHSSGVYGPRKMRLFAKSGSGYTYSRLPHPRHEPGVGHRHARLGGLHPHVQQGRTRAVPAGTAGYTGGDAPVAMTPGVAFPVMT